MLLRKFMFWLPMIFIAVFNGAVREFTYKTYTGDLAAHQISTFVLIVLFSVYVWFIWKNLKITTFQNAVKTGIFWVLLTVIFEFSLGYAGGNSFQKMLQDYNFFEGRLWGIFLICFALVPLFIFKLKNQERPKTLSN